MCTAVPGVEVYRTSDRVFLLHIGGKIEVGSKVPLKNRDDLYEAAIEVVVREGLTVTEVAEDPLGLEPAVSSTALAIEETDGKRSWRYLLWTDGEKPRHSQESSTVPAWSFEEWLEAYAVDTVETIGRDLVTFGPGETLEAGAGTTILEQRRDPDLPAPFAPASARTAVAQVERADQLMAQFARRAEATRRRHGMTTELFGTPLDDAWRRVGHRGQVVGIDLVDEVLAHAGHVHRRDLLEVRTCQGRDLVRIDPAVFVRVEPFDRVAKRCLTINLLADKYATQCDCETSE